MRRIARGALLLEVVVAMAILVVAMGIIGTQMTNSLKMVGQAEQQTRAVELTDRLLALLELDQELQQRVFLDRETTGNFGTEYPGYSWRVDARETDVEGLKTIVIEVLWKDANAGDEEPRPVRAIALLKADPGRINLAEDFGVEDEQIEQLTNVIPIPGFDPAQFDPQALVSLDPQTLMQLLPAIMPLLQQMFGGDLGALLDFANDLRDGQIPEGLGEDGEGLPQLPGMDDGRTPGGNPGGNAGGNRGGGTSLDDLRRMGAGANGGATGGGNRGNAGGNGGGRQTHTIEDLMRMRDQNNRR